jgi:hypothetical protein
LLGLSEKADTQTVQSLESYFQPEDYAQLLSQLKQNGQVNKREVQLQRADGSKIWVSVSKTISTIDDQIIIDGLLEDISDRKRVEEERHRREREFKALVENAPDIIARLDRELRYIYVNPAVEQATGLSPEMLIGKTRAEFGAPEEVYTPWQEATRQVFVTGKECLHEFKFPARDGMRYFQTRMVPEFALDGTVESVLAIGRDVTEYKRVERALRESEARFKRLVQSNIIGCIFWTEDGKIIDANDAFLQMVGYPRDDLLSGKLRWKDITPPEQLPLSEQAIAKIKQSGAATFEQEYIRVDGNRVPVLLGGVLLEGYQDRGVSFVLDLSERKRLESELRQQAEELAHANRIKDEFLAVLSHELRSPLNSILGWSKLLRTRKFDEATIAKALETIERNATMQTRLIEDLLDVSRIIRGKTSLNVGLVDLSLTIEAAIDTVHLAAQAKSIEIESVIDAKVGIISGDPNRLQQVVWNLLSNAIKFTPPSGRVLIRLERKEQYAQIQVSDTGKGISADFVPHVFEYFRQADSSSTRTEGGLGLGLAIVRHLVELHGGTVSASSPGLGKGATFTVTLPLTSSEFVLHTTNASNVTTASRSLTALNSELEDSTQNRNGFHRSALTTLKTQNSLQGIQVLVVDDNTDTRDFCATVLRQSGAEVIVATSAAEAFDTIQRQRPDVLVSDIGMPGEDGYTLLKKVREWEAERGDYLPAVALTAYARKEDCKKALDAGFQKHISKPVSPDDLVRAIASLKHD